MAVNSCADIRSPCSSNAKPGPRIALALLLSSALPCMALSPVPQSDVTDNHATRLLAQAYDEPVNLKSGWTGQIAGEDKDDGASTVARTVCLDSGDAQSARRLIAVCSSFEDAGHASSGLVDLWVLRAAYAPQAPPMIAASERGLTTGSWGVPGNVALFELGPGQTAFALSSTYATMGWATEQLTLYRIDGDRIVSIFTLATHLSNSGVCDPEQDKSCLENSVNLDCTLRARPDPLRFDFYDLAVEVSGRRGGKSVQRTIPVGYVPGGKYRTDNDVLKRDGCDEGF